MVASSSWLDGSGEAKAVFLLTVQPLISTVDPVGLYNSINSSVGVPPPTWTSEITTCVDKADWTEAGLAKERTKTITRKTLRIKSQDSLAFCINTITLYYIHSIGCQ